MGIQIAAPVWWKGGEVGLKSPIYVDIVLSQMWVVGPHFSFHTLGVKKSQNFAPTERQLGRLL